MTAPRKPKRKTGEHGFALAAALLAVVLIGALVAGVFFATMEETTVGSTFRARQLALNAAESALENFNSASVRSRVDSMPLGSAFSVDVANARVYITRVDSSIYWLVADSEFGADGARARRRIGLTVTSIADSSDSRPMARVPGQAWVELF